MNSKFYKNEKFQTWFFPILYFLLAISIVITGCFTFKKVYYQPIVVTGTSMWPTLSGGVYSTVYHDEETGKTTSFISRSHYGYADLHKSSINELKRFDVVVTYYPRSWNTESDPRIVDDKTYYMYRSFKIKRVWGFPGETISLNYNEGKYTFTASKNGAVHYKITSSPVKLYQTYYEFRSSDEKEYKYLKLNFQVFEFTLSNKTFRVSYETPSTSSHNTRSFTRTLAGDEYFVMGDNFQGSTDCYTKVITENKERLTNDYVQGRVICINSYTTYKNSNTYDNHSIEGMYEF